MESLSPHFVISAKAGIPLFIDVFSGPPACAGVTERG